MIKRIKYAVVGAAAFNVLTLFLYVEEHSILPYALGTFAGGVIGWFAAASEDRFG